MGCGQRRLKNELVRIVSGPEGVRVDTTDKAGGRGAHVCPQSGCFEAAARRGRLARSLKTGLDSEQLKELREVFTVYIEERGATADAKS